MIFLQTITFTQITKGMNKSKNTVKNHWDFVKSLRVCVCVRARARAPAHTRQCLYLCGL